MGLLPRIISLLSHHLLFREEQGEQNERRIRRLIVRKMNEERKQQILFSPKVC